MKIAILIQCYKNARQINDLINSFDDNFVFFIHVDKKSNIQKDIVKKSGVYFVPDDRRVDVKWGTMSIVDASIEALKLACESNVKFDYAWQISGQDFPIKSSKEIVKFFEDNNGYDFFENIDVDSRKYTKFMKRVSLYYPSFILKKSFISRAFFKLYLKGTGGYYKTLIFKRKPIVDKFYFGSAWWAFTKETSEKVLEFISNNKKFLKFYKNTLIPDEGFFQTIVLNFDQVNKYKPYLHYLDFSARLPNPKTLDESDFSKIKESEYLIARKFDYDVDKKIVEMIQTQILNKE